VRRGDALGLRALADEFADAVAPDLSNRVRDGRWVTILAWCLARSHEVFHASGGRSVTTRTEQRERYAWLRPLELMWVARTISLAKDWKERSLAGQRSVKPWFKDDDQSTDRFGMSDDQFRAYRQTGEYGGYRVAFRKWPGMTVLGDGWTPAKATIQLAKWLDDRLRTATPPWRLHAGEGAENGFPTPDKRSLGKEHGWWLRQWRTFARGGTRFDENTLPRRRDDFGTLPEAAQLRPLLFGDDTNGKRRLNTAREVARAAASSHLEVCEHLGRVFGAGVAFALLPRFSRLADAGMAAMDLLATPLQSDSRADLAVLAARPEAKSICTELMAAAVQWRKTARADPHHIRHVETAHRFADAIISSRPSECLRALLQYHEMHGGGLRWFVLRDNWIEPRTPWRAGASRYRFRLWPLCRLAAQCGVIRNMPRALLADDAADADEDPEGVNE